VFSGPVTLSSLINCSSLATDSTGIIKCGNAVTSNSAVAFTDSSPATLSDSNLTELFNDSSKPNITPGSNSQNVLVSTHMRFSGGGNRDTDAAIRVVRNIGSSANCSSGVQVGDSFSTFLTKNNFNHDANGTFLDTPNTTSPVYYTVCSSSNSQFGSTPVSERIDVTLMRIGQ
jgi:hypothetical protein